MSLLLLVSCSNFHLIFYSSHFILFHLELKIFPIQPFESIEIPSLFALLHTNDKTIEKSLSVQNKAYLLFQRFHLQLVVFFFAKVDWNKMKMEKIDHFTFKFEILVEYSIILFIIIIIIVVFYCIFFLHSHSGEKTGRFAALLLYYTIPHQTIEESKIVLQSMFRASTVWCVAPR